MFFSQLPRPSRVPLSIQQFLADYRYSQKFKAEHLAAILGLTVVECTDAWWQKLGVDFWISQNGRWIAADAKVSRHPYKNRILVEILEWPKNGMPKPGWAAKPQRTDLLFFVYYAPRLTVIEVPFSEVHDYAVKRFQQVIQGGLTDSYVCRSGRIALFDLPKTCTFTHKAYIP